MEPAAATIGKQVGKIKVTDLEGNRIWFGRATGRYFLKMVSSFEFMLGYLISFSDQRQNGIRTAASTMLFYGFHSSEET